MVLLNPKVLALLFLLGFAVVVSTPKPGGKLRVIDLKGSQAARQLQFKSGELERLKQTSDVKEGTVREAIDPRPEPEKFTVEGLIRAMEQAMVMVPRYVPHLPMMGSLAREMMRQGLITVEATDPGVMGHFSYADSSKPKIVISEKVARMHADGVPMRLLVPVLVHELDHMMTYLTSRRRGKKRTMHESEHSAFRSEYFYMFGLGRKDAEGDGVVDAERYDPETRAYMKDLKRMRQKLFAGDLSDLIRDRYGADRDLK